MKKGWKIFWIVCASVAAVGLVLCIGGALLGATMEGVQRAMWERAKEDYDSGTGAVEVIEPGDEGTGASDGDVDVLVGETDASGADTGLGEDVGSDSEVIGRYKEIEELEVDVTYLEVVVTEGEVAEVIVSMENIPEEAKQYLAVSQDGQELEIEIRSKQQWKPFLNNRDKVGTLKIQIPKDKTFRSVSLSGGAGVLDVEHIQAEELDVEIGAGQAKIRDFTAGTFDLECGVGEAIVSGDASAESKIECGVGTVTYTAAGAQKDYNYELECSAGVIRVGKDEYSGLMNEKRVQNGGGARIEVECGIGEVNILFDKK